jgi:hypothetical protein
VFRKLSPASEQAMLSDGKLLQGVTELDRSLQLNCAAQQQG